MLVGCAIWMLIGILVMRKMINFDYLRRSHDRSPDRRQARRRAVPAHDAGRGRGGARPSYTRRHAAVREAKASHKRMKAVASEREQDPRRASATGSTAEAKRSRCARSRSSSCGASSTSFNLSDWLAQEAARDTAGHGRLSRPAGRHRLPVLPPGDADRPVSVRACSMSS